MDVKIIDVVERGYCYTVVCEVEVLDIPHRLEINIEKSFFENAREESIIGWIMDCVRSYLGDLGYYLSKISDCLESRVDTFKGRKFSLNL